jgi:hypothetical protein
MSRLNQTAPPSSIRPRSTTGKVFVEKGQVLEDLIADSELSRQNTKRFIRTEVINNDLKSGGDRTPPPKVDLKRGIKDDNPHADAVAKFRAKREKLFPIILENVDKATDFLNEIDKEMNLVNEAKRNKTRRQFEEWNQNVHGEIQVSDD